MAQIIICGTRNNYYLYKGKLYTGTFPLKWVKSCLPETGPEECPNCEEYGSWNGVFIGYCPSCAQLYNGKRGSGFCSYGVEQDETDMYSASQTYLAGIRWVEIGKFELFSDSMDKYFKYKLDVEILNNLSDTRSVLQKQMYNQTEIDSRVYDEKCRLYDEIERTSKDRKRQEKLIVKQDILEYTKIVAAENLEQIQIIGKSIYSLQWRLGWICSRSFRVEDDEEETEEDDEEETEEEKEEKEEKFIKNIKHKLANLYEIRKKFPSYSECWTLEEALNWPIKKLEREIQQIINGEELEEELNMELEELEEEL